MHPDRTTTAPGLSHFCFRAGPYAVAIQSAEGAPYSPYGIALWRPEQFVRKEATWLFHPENGLAGTMLSLLVGDERYRPEHGSTAISWEDRTDPTSGVLIEWTAGPVVVRERLFPDIGGNGLQREVLLTSSVEHEIDCTLIATLTPNPLRYLGLPSVRGDSPGHLLIESWQEGRDPVLTQSVLSATDGSQLEVETFERFHLVRCSLKRTGPALVNLTYSATPASAPQRRQLTSPFAEGERGGGRLEEDIVELVGRSLAGIDCMVSEDGRFDASVWQYGYEWGQDAALVAEGLCYAGATTLAKKILGNLLRRLTDEDGRIAESSRFRGGDLAELNANGAVLQIITSYLLFTDDLEFLREHQDAIVSIGTLVVAVLEGSDSDLIHGRRDLWERLPWMGVEYGADIATNAHVARGLRDGAYLLERLGEDERAQLWREKSSALQSALMDEERGLIDDGRFVHRRLHNGALSREMRATGRYHDERYRAYLPAPSSELRAHVSDPDSVAALPILLGLADPESAVAIKTMRHLHEHLWDRVGGGYYRSPPASDPDSPGPWAFVTAWMAEAELRAGLDGQARQSTLWLHEQSGEAGSFMEYYGPRASPPFPPIGLIVWGWGQYLLLAMRGWCGLEVTPERLTVTPRMEQFTLSLTVSGFPLLIEVTGRTRAQQSGTEIDISNGTATLTLPLPGPTRLTFE